MADSDDVAPLIPTDNNTDKVPAYKDAPLPPIDPPLPSNPMTTGDALPSQPPEYSYPQDQPDTGYDVQYPSTYHPQYTSDQQKQNTNVIVQQQPNTIYEQRVYTRHEDYGVHFVLGLLLLIWSGFACLACPPFGLVACFLTRRAVCFPGDHHNPHRIMIVALVFIILSFVIGIPCYIILLL